MGKNIMKKYIKIRACGKNGEDSCENGKKFMKKRKKIIKNKKKS